MSDIADFLAARYDEDEALGDPHAVWQLDHDGYGTSLHASAYHAKAHAESREASGTYWRWDDGRYWLKRHGETIATIQPVQVLGVDPDRVAADLAGKRFLLSWHEEDRHRVGRCSNCHTNLGQHHLWPCHVVKALAAPYAAHPDFKPGWRIDG